MKVYVQSGGVSKEYSWVNEQNQPIVLPDDDLKPMLNMVDSDYFSVVIYRPKEKPDKLLLLVTALPSQDRMDNRTRKLYNSVLWVGDTSNEKNFRAITIKALNGELATQVDPSVYSDNDPKKPGFTVEFEKLNPDNLVPPDFWFSPDVANQKNPDDDSHKIKIGNLSACKDKLTEELKSPLPEKKGMLVVVCSTVSDSSLKQAEVWRGLSDTISGEDWIEFPVKEENKNANFPSTGTSTSKNVGGSNSTTTATIGFPPPNRNPQNFGQIKKWLNLIAAFILGLVIGIIANQLWYHFTENQLQQRIQSLKGDITELEQEKNSLGKAIKIKQQEIQVYEKFESESETRYSHFRDEVEKSYDSFIRDSQKSKQALQSEINALQNKANELNAKSS
jgi:gas vesicle protein